MEKEARERKRKLGRRTAELLPHFTQASSSTITIALGKRNHAQRSTVPIPMRLAHPTRYSRRTRDWLTFCENAIRYAILARKRER